MSNTKSIFTALKGDFHNSKRSFANFYRGLGGVLAAGILLGTVHVSPALADPQPVRVKVIVTGADGSQGSGASVTVTQAGGQPGNPTAISGGGNAGVNGLISVTDGSSPTNHESQSLPPGVYQVEVVLDGEYTVTYVNVPEGQTSLLYVEFSSAPTIDRNGPGHAEAAADAAAAAESGDQAAYDAAIARINEIIEFREQAIEDFERALDRFERTNYLYARDFEWVRSQLEALQFVKRGGGTPAISLPLYEEYYGLWLQLEIWRNAVDVMLTALDDVPLFSYHPSTDAEDDAEYALLGRPWLAPEMPSVMAHRPAMRVNIPVHHHF